MKPDNQRRLMEAKALIEVKDYAEAMRLVNKALDDEPDMPQGLYMAGFIALEEERFGLARALLHRCIELEPNKSEVWNAYGRTFQEGHDLEQAKNAYTKAMALDPKNPHPCINLGLQYMVQGKPDKAIPFLQKADKISPDLREVKYNLSLCKLFKRDWSGWDDYNVILGHLKDRKERVYQNETRWDGSKDKTVVVYGEQGIGDEVTFASVIPDLIKDSKKVIIECDRRLEGVFKRTFPEADVYGTRFQTENIDWIDNYKIDARVAMGALPMFYRRRDSDFPGKPFLVPDPERKIQWRALLDSLGPEPKIGIAWSGGIRATGALRRSLKLEQLKPILSQKAHFISLEYLDRHDEIERFKNNHNILIHHWDRAVSNSRTVDYEDTLALMSELDLVVGVQTAAIRCAAFTGTPVWVMLPEWPNWLWGDKGDFIWSKDVKIYRQRGSWDFLIRKVANDLKVFLQDSRNELQPERVQGIR